MSDCLELDVQVECVMPSVYFSDFFEISRDVIDEYGAFDISLVNDIPLFVDPFLIYKNKKYQALHESIVKYLMFLQENASPDISDENLHEWFMFHEVKENWLGFSVDGNKGSGLANDFAFKLNLSVNELFKEFGGGNNSDSVHIEKFCLCQDKIGKDKISDFTTNIIKDYLLSYTEIFAKEHLSNKYCKNVPVKKAYFDYDLKIWCDKDYYLPLYKEEHVILSPIELLTKDDTWICKNDVTKSHTQFKKVLSHISSGSFSKEVFDFYNKEMLLSSGDRSKHHKVVMNNLIRKYPSYLDYYIKYKTELDGANEAAKLTKTRVFNATSLFVTNGSNLISQLVATDFFKRKIYDLYTLREKVLILKDIIEKNCSPLFIKDKRITNAKEIGMLFSILLKVNDCNGNKFKLKNSFEVKLASNPYLDNYFIDRSNNCEPTTVVMIICYDIKKSNAIKNLIAKYNLSDDENIIIVEAVHVK